MSEKLILNDQTVSIEAAKGSVLLDFIRYRRNLTGTKIGCREGDCGACTVLVGSLNAGQVTYKQVTSCLMPLANAAGKHIVTVEGLNGQEMTPYQKAITGHSGTQCGFCTPGFIVSLAAYCLEDTAPSEADAISAMDGNICRCTGYKSIERAAAEVAERLQKRPQGEKRLAWLIANGYVPAYFAQIPQRLAALDEDADQEALPNPPFCAGGSDLYVQKPEEMSRRESSFLADRSELKGISLQDGRCRIGAAVTAEELRRSALLNQMIPNFVGYMNLVASTPIRNMATVAGNLVNASPIGDMTMMLLALGATLELRSADGTRRLELNQFFQDYKKVDLAPNEWIEALSFPVPDEHTKFNFEKVSKRTYLDIASVNTAIRIRQEDGKIAQVTISAGGVAPIPMVLHQTALQLAGAPLNAKTVQAAAACALTEIKPIADARGSASYKRLLLQQLIFAHFLELFPDHLALEDLQ